MTMANKLVEYSCGKDNHIGYFSWDDTIDGIRPGVVLIHEWWGLNDYMHSRADQVAELGYCAFAIDMYGEGEIADHPDRAGQLMQSVTDNMVLGDLRLHAGYEALLAQSLVDNNKTAAMGYCFGGAMALHMARVGMPVKAVTSFHGALQPFHHAKPGDIAANILVCHGKQDDMVSAEHVSDFRKEMDELGADYDIQEYGDARHGFTNPEADANREKYGVPLGYNQAADASSWIAMQNQLARAFS